MSIPTQGIQQFRDIEETKSIYYTFPLDGMLVYRRLTLSILLHGIIISPRVRLNKQIFASKGVKFVFLG